MKKCVYNKTFAHEPTLEESFFEKRRKKVWGIKVKWENTKSGKAETMNQAFLSETKQVQ